MAEEAMDDGLLLSLLEVVLPGRRDSTAARSELAATLRRVADKLDSLAHTERQQRQCEPDAGGALQPRPQEAGSRGPCSEVLPSASGGDQEGQANCGGLKEGGQAAAGQRLTKKQRKGKGHREFRFDRYAQRHVALEVLYIGWDFHGFASVADSDNTIEAHLFRALETTRLIPSQADRASLRYSRCGRTDKGVSALGQVIALRVRSAAISEDGIQGLPLEDELDYPGMLNRALPKEIRVLGWSPVEPIFNARFDATWREYKYFIVPGNDINIVAMQEAASQFVGIHDFRHFCKLDAANVNNFVRRIEFFNVNLVDGCRWAGGRQLYELHLRGSAFLWHQVRCMAAILMMVGQGLEDPSVVAQYLDVDAEPRKPQYGMAGEDPLILHSCGFEALDFRRTPSLQSTNITVVAAALNEHLVRAGLLWSVVQRLKSDTTTGPSGVEDARQAARHIPLRKRAKEPTVEERLARYGKAPVSLTEYGTQPGRLEDSSSLQQALKLRQLT